MQLFKRHLLALLLLVIATMALVAFACGDDEEGDGGEPTATAPAGGDLSDIPEDTTGITDTEIKLGSHLPLTGIAGIYGNAIAPSMQAYFSYVNDNEGGVNGRKITMLIEDDAYEPPQTNTVVRKLVEQDGVFAMVSGLGTATHSAVFEYLSNAKIPDMFISSGATLFTDPVTRTAFGFNPNYVQEGTALGAYIVENFPGAKVGLLIQNDDFGKDGEKGVRAGLEGSDVEVVSVITYEAAQTDMTSQVQNLQNAGATV
ncbi:MAG: ABC transporter substrate-binding protein, partial [Chloroflexi bacterium]|nr:ABC transporter substrate-binding protein [Chloroflexota bacterium]